MSTAGNQSAGSTGTLDIRAADLVDVLAKRNPDASRVQVAFAARVMALVGTAIQTTLSVSLPTLLDIEASLERADDWAERPSETEGESGSQSHVLRPRGSVEIGQGKGLGPLIGLAEGRRRLAAYASPLTMEEWAGPLAGSAELNRRLGIARSTLQDWRRSGAVIGLLKGQRKHVFPLAQFVDGKPVAGLAETVAIVGDARMAWLWLVEPYSDGGSPLDDLKHGRIEDVLDAAREDFA